MSAAPILKWAGGKGSLLPQYEPFFPARGSYKRYIEPFVGSGAVFFHLYNQWVDDLPHPPAPSPNSERGSHQLPECVVLMDGNPELIEVYMAIRDQVDELIAALAVHRNEREHFYEVRAQKPTELTPVERTARFIFLNKTCYNGLYRVNRSGQFNVPFGRYDNPAICDELRLRVASTALQKVELKVADFNVVLSIAQAGDLIYFDPPYEPLSPTSSFTSYTRDGFSSDDQRRLADMYRQLDARGCQLMLSNSSAPLIRELYTGYHIHEISARRAINSKANGRGKIIELLITNF